MSADYDRLFHSSEAAEAGEDETTTVDPKAVQAALAAAASMPTGRPEATRPNPCPSRRHPRRPPPRRRRAPPRSPPRCAPTPPAAGQQRAVQPNGMMRAPQGSAPARCPLRAAVSAPPAAGAARPPPAPSQHFADAQRRAPRAPGPRPARARVGGEHRQPPRDRRPVPRRRAVRGQGAVAARLAAIPLPVDTHQRGPVARRDLRAGSVSAHPPQRPRLVPDRRVRTEGRSRQDRRHRGPGLGAEQDPRRPHPGHRRRSRRRATSPTVPAGSPRRPSQICCRTRIAPLQRYPRVHQHERLEPRGALLGGLQRRAPRVQRGGLGRRGRHRLAVLQPGARRLRCRPFPVESRAGCCRRSRAW